MFVYICRYAFAYAANAAGLLRREPLNALDEALCAEGLLRLMDERGLKRRKCEGT